MTESRESQIQAEKDKMDNIWSAVNKLGGLDNFPLLVEPFKKTAAIVGISLFFLELGKRI